MLAWPSSPTACQREGRQGTTCAIAGLWADVDVRGSSHRQDALPETLEEALALIRRAVQPEPSLLVDSGMGSMPTGCCRAWDFRIGGDETAERLRARSLSDQLQRAIRQEARRAGYAIETTADLARVLRIPGSLNTKIPDDPRLVRVISESGIRYGIEELEEALPRSRRRNAVRLRDPYR